MRIGDGLGERVRKYRKARGLSTQRLADASDGVLSRFTVVAIESGRKKSAGTDEVALLAALLGVPPIALLLPIDRPFDRVEISPDWTATVVEAIDWLTAQDAPKFSDGYVGSVSVPHVGPPAILFWLERYRRAQADAQGAATLATQGVYWIGPGAQPTLEDAQRRMEDARERLQSLGVDLSTPRPDSEP